MSYDPRCHDLAALFLSDNPEIDTEAKRAELAQLIQTTIEDFIAYGDHGAVAPPAKKHADCPHDQCPTEDECSDECQMPMRRAS